MCVYWPSANRGVFGLAADGPKSGAKITPAVDELTVHDVTAVVPMDADAAQKWEEGPWGS